MSRMADQWIVRVEGREYGPVDLEELRAWKREGRLIRENEIREPGNERWIRAEELPEIFADEAAEAQEAEPAKSVVRRQSFGEISRCSFRSRHFFSSSLRRFSRCRKSTRRRLPLSSLWRLRL
jgi:hypothetical protein